MKGTTVLKINVKIGGKYKAKVGGFNTTVTILRESPTKGWYARNERTGREVYIRSAQRLRGPA